MKTGIVAIRAIVIAICWLGLNGSVEAQCNNNTYALSTSGIIYQVDTSTLALTAISSAAPGASYSNAMGYKGSTNTFYFFSNSGLTGCPTCISFYSYTPAVAPAGVFTQLSMINGPSGGINTGTISFNGNGYYCISTSGYLYYYNILLNTWTTIATTIKDQWGQDITSTIAAYSSGDMAFDGNGNLFLLVGNSSTNKYGLYRFPPVVPTTNVGTVTLQQIIAPGASMPDNSVPVGISFTSTGTMFISTLANDMYAWRDTKGTPVLKGTFSQNIFDLSSCSLPMNPLPVHFTSINTDANGKGEVNVVWNVVQEMNTNKYVVQRSNDGLHWTDLATIESIKVEDLVQYYYQDFNPANGTNYYRIKEVDINGQVYFSRICKVQIQSDNFHIWPNPASDVLYIDNNTASGIVNCTVISSSGKHIKNIQLHGGTNTVDIKELVPGTYVFVMQSNSNQNNQLFVKQ